MATPDQQSKTPQSFRVPRQLGAIFDTSPLAQARRVEIKSLLSGLHEIQAASEDGSGVPASGMTDELFGDLIGDIVEEPINRGVARQMSYDNEYAANCLRTAVTSAVGHGHADEEIYDALNPLAVHNWQTVLDQAVDDYFTVGDGFIEVVREGPSKTSKIVGVHYVQAVTISKIVRVYEGKYLLSYAHGGTHAFPVSGSQAVYPAFGETEEHTRAHGHLARRDNKDGNYSSEIINLRHPTTRSRWYGCGDWVASGASVDLMKAVSQYEMDFYVNRGVPEFMMFITGGRIDEKAWLEIKADMQSIVGLGQSHQALVYNFEGQEIEVKIERLAIDDPQGQQYSDKRTGYALGVATASGTPLVLAGIQVPGKVGANNEGPNAIATYQAMRIHPHQRNISEILAATLGNPQINGGLAVSAEMFLGKTKPIEHPQAKELLAAGMPVPQAKERHRNGFRTLTEALDLQAMEGVSKMREPMAGSGRDPKEGTLERGEDRGRRA